MDKLIKFFHKIQIFYYINLNLLLDICSRVSKEFHRKYVLIPADKATHNVVVVCDALSYFLDNIYIRFGTKLYKQIIGIPICTNRAYLKNTNLKPLNLGI